MRRFGFLIALLALAGCAAPEAPPPPVTPPPPRSKSVEAMVALKPGVYGLLLGKGAGAVLTDGVAVTVNANRAAIDPRRIFGEAKQFGLLFFAAKKYLLHMPEGEAAPELAVMLYGQDGVGDTRSLRGKVMPDDPALAALPFDARRSFAVLLDSAAEGVAAHYLGAPVLDDQGRLVGMTTAIVLASGKRYALAYRLSFVRDVLSGIVSAQPGDPN